MKVITGPGWGVLLGGAGVAAAGLAVGYRTLTGLGMAAAVALTAALVMVLIRPSVTVTRTVTPSRVTAGEPALIRLDVRNIGRLPTPRFDAVEHLDGVPLAVRVAPLGRQQSRPLRVPIPTSRRGLVRLGPIVVERYDPLGLARRAQPLSGSAWLWIHPRVHPVPALPLGVVLDFEGRLADRAAKGSTAFTSLREYQAGDDPRHIHWRSTARLGTLLVREHVDTTEPTTTVLVDTRGDQLDVQRFEEAVEVAASVAVASTRVGHGVHLAALGEDLQAVRDAGGHQLLDRLSALERVGPAGHAAVVRLADQARPGGSLVVVSGDDAGLVSELARLRRRFTQVVVVQIAPQGDGEPAHSAARLTRRSGLAIVRAGNALDAVRAWSRLVGGTAW